MGATLNIKSGSKGTAGLTLSVEANATPYTKTYKVTATTADTPQKTATSTITQSGIGVLSDADGSYLRDADGSYLSCRE